MAGKKGPDLSALVAMTHDALLAEIPKLDRMSQAERLKHNRRRREKQIKKWKEMEEKEFKKNVGRGGAKKSSGSQSEKNGDGTNEDKHIDFISQSKLFDFVSKRHLKDLKTFLDKYGEEEQVCLIGSVNHHGMTALHKCVAEGATKIAGELISRGADVNIGDKDHWTPLHAASFIGDLDMVDLFVANGADLKMLNLDLQSCLDLTEARDVKDYLHDQFKRQKITEEMVQEMKNAPCVCMLSEAEALCLEELNKCRFDNGATLLHIAASNGFDEVVETLIKRGVALEAKDEDGWTPLHAAVYWGQESIIAKLLLGDASFHAETISGEDVLALAPNDNLRERIEIMFTDYTKEKAKHFFESIDLNVVSSRDTRSSSIMAKTLLKSPEKEDHTTTAMLMGTNLGVIDDRSDDDETFKLFFKTSVDISDPYLHKVYGDNYEPKKLSLATDSLTGAAYSIKQSSRDCIFHSNPGSVTPMDEDGGNLSAIQEEATRNSDNNLKANSESEPPEFVFSEVDTETGIAEELTRVNTLDAEPAPRDFAKTQSLEMTREQQQQHDQVRTMSDIQAPKIKRGKNQTSFEPRIKDKPEARNKQTKRHAKNRVTSKTECTIF